MVRENRRPKGNSNGVPYVIVIYPSVPCHSNTYGREQREERTSGTQSTKGDNSSRERLSISMRETEDQSGGKGDNRAFGSLPLAIHDTGQGLMKWWVPTPKPPKNQVQEYYQWSNLREGNRSHVDKGRTRTDYTSRWSVEFKLYRFHPKYKKNLEDQKGYYPVS